MSRQESAPTAGNTKERIAQLRRASLTDGAESAGARPAPGAQMTSGASMEELIARQQPPPPPQPRSPASPGSVYTPHAPPSAASSSASPVRRRSIVEVKALIQTASNPRMARTFSTQATKELFEEKLKTCALEDMLDDDEFDREFNMSRHQFKHMSQWKQVRVKKELGIF